MRKGLALTLLAIALAGCGESKATTAKITDLETRNEDLTRQVAKLDTDLKETQRQLVVQQQAMQAMSERLRTVETGVDKLAYGSASSPR